MQYVVLHHTGYGPPHYDLLIAADAEGLLLSWRTPVWPIEEGVELTRLPDHRRLYLDYEGTVSGGRGHVRRVAYGKCDVITAPPSRIRFEDGLWWELAEVARRVS